MSAAIRADLPMSGCTAPFGSRDGLLAAMARYSRDTVDRMPS